MGYRSTDTCDRHLLCEDNNANYMNSRYKPKHCVDTGHRFDLAETKTLSLASS